MTTYVQVSEEDPALDLVRRLNALDSSKKIDEGLVQDEQYLPVLQRAFAIFDKILAQDDKTATALISLLFSLLQLVDSSSVNDLVNQFGSLLANKPANKSALKLQLLTNLFNLLGEASPSRAKIFGHMLEVAVAGKLDNVIRDNFASVADWLQKWQLSVSEKSELLRLLYVLHRDSKQDVAAQSFLLQFLNSAQDHKKAASYAVEGVVYQLSTPSVLQMESFSQVASVAALASNSEHKALAALLQIAVSGTVADFFQFQKDNQPVFAKYGLDASALLVKLRTLQLATLGAASPKIALSSLVSSLQVADELEVEQAVFDAIQTGQFDAKIDHQTSTLSVVKTFVRTFDSSSDWSALSEQLTSLTDNTRNILHMLHQVRLQATA